MEINESTFGGLAVKYFLENFYKSNCQTAIAGDWLATVEGFVDGEDIDAFIDELMAEFQSGCVGDQIDKMSEEHRNAFLEFLSEGRQELTGIISVCLKCAASDFAKSMDSFIANLGARRSNCLILLKVIHGRPHSSHQLRRTPPS